MSQKALSLDESESSSHALMGSIYLLKRKYEEAIASGKQAVELNPNGAMIHALLGNTFGYAGYFDEAIAQLKQAIRLNPFPAYYYYYHLGRCYNQKGRYEDALAEFKKAVKRAPDHGHLHIALAVTYMLINREEEARASAAKALEIYPGFTVTLFSKTWRYQCRDNFKIIIEAMRKAGFPE